LQQLGSIWNELKQTDFTVRHVDADGISTRVLEAGEGPYLILANGTTGHLECYARVIAPLSRKFRVVCFDAVGHGLTDKPNEPYTPPLYAAHMRALLDRLEIGTAILSGESLGALVSAWFSMESPERVERLVLNTPGNILDKPEIMVKLSSSTRAAYDDPSPETVQPRLEWLFAPENRHLVSDELVENRIAMYSEAGSRQALENILVLQDPIKRAPYSWREEWCSKIVAPTLIIWTSDDPTGKPEEGRLLERWIPNSRYMLVNEAGHWLQWERPDEFVRIHLELARETA
jgi:2-hydroxy-6-oxonona-2,4-dienedioate hydrolase